MDSLVKSNLTEFEPFFGTNYEIENITSFYRSKRIEEDLCGSQRRIIYPKAAKDSELDWLFVVNTDNFQQGIQIEECT